MAGHTMGINIIHDLTFQKDPQSRCMAANSLSAVGYIRRIPEFLYLVFKLNQDCGNHHSRKILAPEIAFSWKNTFLCLPPKTISDMFVRLHETMRFLH